MAPWSGSRVAGAARVPVRAALPFVGSRPRLGPVLGFGEGAPSLALDRLLRSTRADSMTSGGNRRGQRESEMVAHGGCRGVWGLARTSPGGVAAPFL